jgi:hypothetical protein
MVLKKLTAFKYRLEPDVSRVGVNVGIQTNVYIFKACSSIVASLTNDSRGVIYQRNTKGESITVLLTTCLTGLD